MPWNCVRNSDRLTARFLCAVEEAVAFGPAHLELEARHVRMNRVRVHLHKYYCIWFLLPCRFGSIFFRAERPLQSHELKEAYPIGSLEQDAIVDTSMVLGINSWTFAAMWAFTILHVVIDVHNCIQFIAPRWIAHIADHVKSSQWDPSERDKVN